MKACLDVVLVAVVGLLLHWLVGLSGLGEPLGGYNIFYRLYWLFERPHLLITAAFCLGSAWWLTRAAAANSLPDEPGDVFARPSAWVLSLAVLALVVGVVGWRYIMFETPLAMDEFSVRFQAQMLAQGEWRLPLPEEWRANARALVPKFVSYEATSGTWSSAYWPVHAMIRSVFIRVEVEGWTNATLGALTILFGVAALRRMQPGRRDGSVLLALAFGSSIQFLVLGMTSYAMPVLLLFNTIWLYCWVRADRVGLTLAPIVGGLALGLHNPFPHALFVAPFLLRLVSERRWRVAVWFASVYALAIVLWYPWMASHPLPWDEAAKFGVPNGLMLFIQSMSLVLVVTWTAPWLAPSLMVAFRTWRSRTSTERDLGLGLLVAMGFYSCFLDTQGHGWGYRYLAPLAINVVILAVAGAQQLSELIPARKVATWVVGASVLALFVQLPMRAKAIREFVRPFAQGIAAVRSSPHAVVIIDAPQLWYGDDLVRNDPWLASPIVMRAIAITAQQRASLASRYGDSLRVIHADEMIARGWPEAGAPMYRLR